jgi:hypothetical protein
LLLITTNNCSPPQEAMITRPNARP